MPTCTEDMIKIKAENQDKPSYPPRMKGWGYQYERAEERKRLLEIALVSLEKYKFPTMIPVITAIKKELTKK